jgi:hypothetical protein
MFLFEEKRLKCVLERLPVKMADAWLANMLAPCGMNCGVCYVYLKKKNPCLGCRGQEDSKPEHCRKCEIKDCAQAKSIDFCSACSSFPCAIIKRMDKSYRQRYQVSLIESAIRQKAIGAEQYLSEERQKWICADCGGVISLHDRVCSECGQGVSPS